MLSRIRLTSCGRQIVGRQTPFTQKPLTSEDQPPQETFYTRNLCNTPDPFYTKLFTPQTRRQYDKRFNHVSLAKPCDPSHHAFLAISPRAVWLRTYELRWWPWSLKGKTVWRCQWTSGGNLSNHLISLNAMIKIRRNKG